MRTQNQSIKAMVEQLRSSLNNPNHLKPSMAVTKDLFNGKNDKTLTLSGDTFNDKK